jgi:hypothetical protein
MIYPMPKPQIDGWMTLPELQWLFGTAMRFKTVVEIGCWKGKSTRALLCGVGLNNGTVTAVDHFKGSADLAEMQAECHGDAVYYEFMKNCSRFPNLKVLKMGSLEAAKKVKSADMVFLDGEHTKAAALADLKAWEPKAAKMICGHDYQFPDVRAAVLEYFGKPPQVVDTIWFVEK